MGISSSGPRYATDTMWNFCKDFTCALHVNYINFERRVGSNEQCFLPFLTFYFSMTMIYKEYQTFLRTKVNEVQTPTNLGFKEK